MAREEPPAHGPTRQLDPALELIFLQAGCAARRAELADRTRAALRHVDFPRLTLELQARRLLPLIGTRLLEAAGDLCPPSFRTAVRTAQSAARVRGLAVYGATRRVSALLAEHDIPALALKGPLLAEEAHGDMGLRETGDVDLLVPRERLDDAAALLVQQGYRPPLDRLRANGLPDLHLVLRIPDGPPVELHWRVHWHEEDFSRRMLGRATPGEDGMLHAHSQDLCASLLLFYARDGFQGVRLAADAAGWWDHQGSESLPPGFLAPHLSAYPDLDPSFTAAAAAVEALTGAPARRWLGTGSATDRRVALATRLADWAQDSDRDQLTANVSLVGALLGPRRSAADFARRELVPDSGPVAPHALKLTARYGVALWRLRRGRRWGGPPSVLATCRQR